MAEIAYDEAPGIPQILFGTAVGVGPVGKAALIDNMVSHGANVIADDTDIPSEPFFQDGVVAQAVDRAHAAGVAYFAAAGNERRQSWEGTFTPSSTLGPSGHALEDFGGGDPVQTIVDVPNGATLRLFLQWDEPVGGATTDLDLYL